MKRRDFLKVPGYFVATASLARLSAGCGDDGSPAGTFAFSQGVASGDPRPDSVVLWTRVEAVAGDKETIEVTAQVSESADFATVVVEETLEAAAASDFTLRLVVTGLSPATRYFYRFVAGKDESDTGRTLTAPAADADVEVNLAWVSCQDFGAGTYGAYRQMLIDDEAAAEADQLDLVVHLGDFIYETTGGQFQVPLDDNFEPIALDRSIDAFPSGGGKNGGERYANTVDDYRHLYKQFLRDPDLREARARWPFVHIWDDHEFTDDCWQSSANYTDGDTADEPSQTRKVAANQAWFEYMPVQLSGATGVAGVEQHAKDFSPTQVEDAPLGAVDDNNLATEPNNLAALDSITVYRSLRYGAHVELVVTDERSYRSDHSIPEELSISAPAIFFHPRTALPAEMVEAFDAGRTANGGNPPAQVLGFDNPRIDSPPGTMLGADQKAWWKQTMMSSDATWKLWCNEVPFMEFYIAQGPATVLQADRVSFCDAWDDKPGERRELTTFLRDNNIENVVILTGDIHAHFAGVVVDDYRAATPQPVATEFIAAGISSNSLFSFFEFATRGLGGQLRDIVTYDSSQLGGDQAFVNNLNTTLRYGTASALAAADTNDLDMVEAARDPDANPFLRFADSNAQGYGRLKVTAGEITATLVTINRPVSDSGAQGPGIRGTATFTVAAGDPGGLSEPQLTGDLPFPLR